MWEAPRRRGISQPGEARKAVEQALGVDRALPAPGHATSGKSLSLWLRRCGDPGSNGPMNHSICLGPFSKELGHRDGDVNVVTATFYDLYLMW